MDTLRDRWEVDFTDLPQAESVAKAFRDEIGGVGVSTEAGEEAEICTLTGDPPGKVTVGYCCDGPVSDDLRDAILQAIDDAERECRNCGKRMTTWERAGG